MIFDVVVRLRDRACLKLRRLRLRGARLSERKTLGDLADNAHLLADIGVTRDEALVRAGKAPFDVRDVYIHSL